MRKKLFVRRIGVIVTSMILVVLAINIAVTGQEKIVLKQASWLWAAPTIAPVMRHLAEQFTKENPNIAIQEAAVSPDQFFDNLLVHLAAKKPADVVNLISYNIALFYEKGYLEPLDSYIDMTKWPAKERLNPVVESAVFDGKTYGTTFQVNNYAILYNMRLFEEAGLTTPNNMEEFFDVAVKLTRGDVFGYAIPTASNQLVYLFDTATHWAVWYGGHFAKDGVPTALDPGVMNGMAGLKRVFDSGAMAKNLSQRDKHTRVVEGKIAMCGAEPVFIMGRAKEERPDVYPDLMYGKAFWPSGKYYTLSLIWSVPKDSQNKEAAAKYLDFLFREDNQRYWMENRLEETPLLGLASPQFVKDNPWYTIFADLKADDLDDKYIDGLEQYKTQVDEILGDSVLEILYFNKDIKEVLENVQKRLEELVKP